MRKGVRFVQDFVMTNAKSAKSGTAKKKTTLVIMVAIRPLANAKMMIKTTFAIILVVR